MSLSITNNVASLTAQHNLNRTSGLLNQSLERLSSGLKINRGADGPAALVISEQQRAQIAGLRAAIDNTNKAVNLVQTGEGALNEINSLLDKVRSLSVDSANSGVNDKDTLAANQAEIRNALDTITHIATNTQFGSKKLLDGTAGITATTSAPGVSVAGTPGSSASSGTYTLDVGTAAAVKANVTDDIFPGSQTFTAGGGDSIVINNVSIDLNAANAGTLNGAISTINSYAGATGVKASVDSVGGGLVLTSAKYGTQGDFTVSFGGSGQSVLGFGNNAYDTQAASTGTTAGVDAQGTLALTGGATATFTAQGNVINALGLTITLGDDTANPGQAVAPTGGTAATITVQNNTLTFQIGANAGQIANIAFQDVRAVALGQNAAGITTGISSLDNIDITTQDGAQDAIRVVDKAISDVSNFRGTLGAFQTNTLQSNANNLQTTLENTTAAESTIRDTDFAAEIANYTKYSVQLQAGGSVLGNANQINQVVASLLRNA
jgi:flagellin